jgi:phosphinothricin acetyltransferase
MKIRSCSSSDIPAICAIYNHYIAHTIITFEEIPLAVTQMQERVNAYTQSYPWLVCEDAGEIVGYAYASKWKERSAYKHTAEVTVYLKHGATQKGYGSALYAQLIEQLKAQGCHVLLGCLSIPNEPSAKLHERFGFKQIAHFSEVGRKFERWIDVVYWQKVL